MNSYTAGNTVEKNEARLLLQNHTKKYINKNTSFRGITLADTEINIERNLADYYEDYEMKCFQWNKTNPTDRKNFKMILRDIENKKMEEKIFCYNKNIFKYSPSGENFLWLDLCESINNTSVAGYTKLAYEFSKHCPERAIFALTLSNITKATRGLAHRTLLTIEKYIKNYRNTNTIKNHLKRVFTCELFEDPIIYNYTCKGHRSPMSLFIFKLIK